MGEQVDARINGGVAQLGEHLPCKQGVKSSNLSISIWCKLRSAPKVLRTFGHGVSRLYNFICNRLGKQAFHTVPHKIAHASVYITHVL